MTQREKTGGRTKGTPNKVTYKIRNHLLSVLAGEIDRIPEYMEDLTPKEKLAFLSKLLPLMMPKAMPVNPEFADFIETDRRMDGLICKEPDFFI